MSCFIQESIRYLFPAGLFEPKARPIMRPPNEIFPKQKAAQFDASGRPHHPFFYTTKPNFFFLLHVNMYILCISCFNLGRFAFC
jgi:small subunit ribosomal protein S9